MFARILPKQPDFFVLFDRHAETTLKGARHLLAMLEDYTDLVSKTTKITEIEHEGDEITHRTIELLHSTFITPMDRDQIHRLVSRMDDVLDAIEAAALEFQVYEIQKPTEDSKQLARLVVTATEHLQRAVTALRDLSRPHEILPHCIEIRSVESQGDAVMLHAVARMFKEAQQPLEVIKWREIYENLENALDYAEDVANVIEGVVLESA